MNEHRHARHDAAPDATTPTVSPCIKVCQLDTQGRCYGCGRTRDEIARWSTMTLEERRAVNARLGFRGHGEHR
ncbi:MAG TPA: DUF1289 domain-containing protein [Gemmatimonadaceae bacterium]|nr:DUF1289 domain-containing protein [Gemmatimonadaceae bacterium]